MESFFSGKFSLRRYFRRKVIRTKNYPYEELTRRRKFRQRIYYLLEENPIARKKELSEDFLREEYSSEEFSQWIFLLMMNFSSEECSGEEFSSLTKKSLAMNVPEKIYPSDELFSQELYGEAFS
jgi:hypothetical protein